MTYFQKVSNLGTTTTEDSFFNFELDALDSNNEESAAEDDFFDFGSEDEDPWNFDDLPPCQTLFAEDAIPGETCDNSSFVPPEKRINDPIYERLIAQVWSDFQYKLNQEAELYGVQLDPFDVDAKLPEPIDIQQQGMGYSADVQMHGIKVLNLNFATLQYFIQ